MKKEKNTGGSTTITAIATPQRAPRKLTKKQQEEANRLEDAEINNNYGPLNVKDLRTAEAIVSCAFLNREHLENIRLLEWSEAVILQLCNPMEPLDFRGMSWATAQSIYIPSLYGLNIVVPLRKASGLSFNLDYYLKKNHKYKVERYNMSDEDMFLTRPTVDYNILKHYESQNSITPYKRLTVQKK